MTAERAAQFAASRILPTDEGENQMPVMPVVTQGCRSRVRTELRSHDRNKTQPHNDTIQHSVLGVFVLHSAPGVRGIACIHSNDFNTISSSCSLISAICATYRQAIYHIQFMV